jgi:hypothetical protein
MAKGFARAPERPLKKRIKRGCVVVEITRVELAWFEYGFEAADVSTRDGGNVVGVSFAHPVEQRMRVDSPMAWRGSAEQIAAVEHVPP